MTNVCPNCDYEFEERLCEVLDCKKPAKYEGWVRVRDGFGISTGLIQLRVLCEDHVYLTIAKENSIKQEQQP